jgi:hypothetical protein
MMLPWWATITLSSICIQYVELENHQALGGWTSVLPKTFVPIVLSQWGLFVGWRDAPSLLTAWSYFTLVNTILRLGISWFVAGQHFDWRTPLGVAAIIAGGQLVKSGLR